MRAVLLASLLILTLSSSAIAIGSGFIENRGQINEAVQYYTLGSRMAVYFTKDAVVFDLKEAVPADGKSPADLHPDPLKGMEPEEPMPRQGCAVYMRFEGASPSPVIEAREKLETEHNYFLGNDPSKWRTGVPAYGEVVYQDLWPGVDLVYRADNGRLTYEVVDSGKGDPERVGFSYEGADRVIADEGGSLRIETPVGALLDIHPGGHNVSGMLVMAEALPEADDDSGGSRDRDNPSALPWSTFLGGGNSDEGYALALDPSGNPVSTGYTSSSDFPTTPGAYDISPNGEGDVFVAKFSAAGSTLLWCTFLGGDFSDIGRSLALDPLGNPVLTGRTESSNFPTTPGAYDTLYGGGYGDVFVAKLSGTGTTLLWSTFLGGGSVDEGHALALDLSGNPVLTGLTHSYDFPTTPGGYDTSHNGVFDVFVAKLSGTGRTLLWSTFLGGSEDEYGFALALDFSGDPVLTGFTWSSDFPTTPGAYDTSPDGARDVFVAKLSGTGTTLLWSTFLGGSSYDVGYSLALDSSGNPVLTGSSESSDFPTTPGAYDTSNSGSDDVFVAKLSGTGTTLLWSTFLGGGSVDEGHALALDLSGNPVLTGLTHSHDFPTTPGGYDTSHNGGYDVFVAKLSGIGSALLWGTFLGGSSADFGYALALDPTGNPVLAGDTYSSDFPTTQGAYDTSQNGNVDAFVAKLRIWPRLFPVAEFGIDKNRSAPTIETHSTDTDVTGKDVPIRYGLYQNVPNPFNPTTTIRFSIPMAGPLALTVHDVAGRLVATIADGVYQPGEFSAVWDGKDDARASAPSGIYFARLHAGEYVAVRKMVLLR